MSETEAGRLVIPGELLGAAEEFVAGSGTYESRGQVYAALLGHVRVDQGARAVHVDAVHSIPHLAEGELVYARVDEIKSQVAVCTLLAAAATQRTVPGAPEGTIHVSKAKEGYTESLGEEFAPGDLVLARILQGPPSVKLTTAAVDLGVVAARCGNCHALLVKGAKGLRCPRCGATEHRKLSQSYGQIGPRAAHHGRGHPPR
jgi:exosome complex component CSL4